MIQVVQVQGFLRKHMEISRHKFVLFYIYTLYIIRSGDCRTLRIYLPQTNTA